MNEIETIRVLLIEDDEDDYLIVKELFKEATNAAYQLDWKKTYGAGLATLTGNQHDVCLLDYRLGSQTGLDMIREATAAGCPTPIIVLTGLGRQEVDVAAMKAGAADYLVKGRFEAHHLERSIRHALERKRAAARAAFEQARLAAFGAQIGLALTRQAPLPAILRDCAQGLVQFLNAGLAQLWTYDAARKALDAQAHAGPVFDAVGSPREIPVPELNLPQLAAGRPVLFKTFPDQLELSTQTWARRQGLCSFVAQPLVLGNRLAGLMSMYSQEPLTESILQELGSVAHGIALCIEHKRAEQALALSEARFQAVAENLREVAFEMDESGRWTFLNPAWTELTGHSVNDTLGKPFLDFIHPADRPDCQQAFLQLRERQTDQCRRPTQLLASHGGPRFVECCARLLVDRDGAILGTAGVFKDLPVFA